MLTAPTHLITPDEPSYDDARVAWNLAIDQRPAAVVVANSVQDVQEAIGYARANDLRVAAQSTGHGASAMGPLDETVLVRTSGLTGVEIDPLARRARVRSGTLWRDVTARAAAHGLAALAGSANDIGVAGYSLGGGMGWLARRYGLQTNSLEAIELVTADGWHLRTDRDNEPELFWALRGGGGNFGVVTALEFALYPVTEVYGGALFFPYERADEVFRSWRAWIDTVPDEVTSVARVLQFPPLEAIPEPMRGQTFSLIEAAVIGDAAQGAALIDPLRALEPGMDTFATMPATALQELHMDPPMPVPARGDGAILSRFDDDAIDAAVAVVGAGSGSPLLSFEVRHAGGELAEARPGNGALAAIPGPFVTFGVGMAADPGMTAAVEERIDLVASALAPYDAGRGYLNFAERPRDPAKLFGAEVYERLAAVKADVDPAGLFQANQEL